MNQSKTTFRFLVLICLFFIQFSINAQTVSVKGDFAKPNENKPIESNSLLNPNNDFCWHYQNPRPQSERLYDIAFVNKNDGWAVGAKGTILRTYNGGEDWWTQNSGTDVELQSVFFVDSFVGWAVGSSGVILKTIDGGLNWLFLMSQTPVYLFLSDVFFINPQVGWVCGTAGNVFRTIDGGTTWTLVITPNPYLTAIFFINQDTGWTVGVDGTILKSVDGGLTWYAQTNNSTANIFDIQFYNSQIGWITGNGGVWKTINGGLTWFSVSTVAGACLFFSDEKNGYVAGGSQMIQKTIDGGITWTFEWTGLSNQVVTIIGLHFINNKIGWFSLVDGEILKTVDGGLTFTKQVKSGNIFVGVDFTDKRNGYIVGNREIYKTENAGGSWNKVWENPVSSFSDIDMVDSLTGYTVGYAGAILKTIDGGVTWQTQVSNSTNWLNSVNFIDSNIGLIVGNNGSILKTINGGQLWDNKTSNSLKNLKSVFFINNLIGFAVGEMGTILKTDDGGESWILQLTSYLNNFNKVYFSNPQNGWIIGQNGIILRTLNGGQSWELVSFTPTGELTGIHFISSNIGYISGITGGASGDLYKTVDGGNIWLRENTKTGNGLYDVFAFDSLNIWAVGYNDAILHYGKPIPLTQQKISICKNGTFPPIKNIGKNLIWYENPIGGIGCLLPPKLDSSVVGQKVFYVSTLYSGAVYGCAESERVSIIFEVGMSSNSNLTISKCNSFVLNGQTYTNSGIYTQTLTNSVGCDSILTLNLTIKKATSGILSQTACGSANINGQTYTNSGIYTQTLTNSVGCDSFLKLNLTINKPTSSVLNELGCNFYDFNGQILTQSGVFMQTLVNSVGCDSVVTLNLQMIPVNVSVTNGGFFLKADENNAVYQWIDCDFVFLPIKDSVGQYFYPQTTGDYAVVVQIGACSDTSDCLHVQIISTENFSKNDLRIFPNPANDLLNIQFLDGKIMNLVVRSIDGKVIKSEILESKPNKKQVIDVQNWNSGLYFLEIQTETFERFRAKFVVVH
jgi:photosystem II stability/assembly factor-like uncharacterized protein